MGVGSRSRPWPVSLYQQTRESCQRMGRLVLWLALAVLLPAPAIFQPLDQAVLEEQEQMKELLTSMFIDNHREGRDLEEDMDEEGEARDMVDDEADTEEGLEVVSSSNPQEIARFNNYMDAIYRRMNAALRAKLMDPMVLNMNPKEKKKRVERAVEDDEEEEEDEVDRMGEVEEEKEDDEEEDVEVEEKNKNKKNKKKHKKKERKTKGDRKKKNKKR